MKNRLQFNRHFALYETREEALNALNTRITDPGFIPLIGEPIVLRYKDANDNVQAILAIGKKAGKSMSDRDYHIVDTADLDEKIAAEVAAREALDAETIKKVIFDGVESQFADNVATLSVSANSIPIGPYEEYVGPVDGPHEIHDYYTVLDAVKQIDVNFEDLADKTNKKLEGLHLVKVTSGLDVNVREAYDLVNVSGIPQENSSRILIYKDSSLYRAYLGHVDDSLTSMSDPTVISGTGDTAICFIYLRVDGFYDLVAVNVEEFIEENEFKDGLVVNNHEVKVKIDANSEGFLTVSADGVKLAGIQNAIDTAKSEEEARAEDAEEAIQAELDNTQVGAGLDSDGSYIQDLSTAYILTATSLANADYILDTELKAVSDYAEASSGALATRINLEEARAQDAEGILSQLVSDEAARALAAETFISAITTNITSGAGLASDGSYIHDHPTAYIGDAKSLANADHILDVNLKAVSDYAEASSGALTTRIDHLDELVAEEVARAIASETFISAITTNIISGAGLSLGEEEGLYPKNHHAGAVIISSAQSLDQADMLLDAAVGGLSGELLTLSSITEAFSGTVENELNYLSGETTSLSAATVNIGENLNTLSENVVSLSGTVETFSAITEDAVEKIDNLSAYTVESIEALSASTAFVVSGTNSDSGYIRTQYVLKSDTHEYGVINVTRNLISGASRYVDVSTDYVTDASGVRTDKTTISPLLLTGDLNNLTGETDSHNGLVTGWDVKQYVHDGIDGDNILIGDNPTIRDLYGRIDFNSGGTTTYDSVHEAFVRTDNNMVRLDNTIGLDSDGINVHLYPSATTQECLLISAGTNIMESLKILDKGIDDMDWSGKTTENEVFTGITQENGHVSATTKLLSAVKLSGYTVGGDDSGKLAETDTLGQALGKLQGQINGMDYSADTATDKVITAITQEDGKVVVESKLLTERVVTGYQVGQDAKVAATDSLGGALGKLQGQINAMDKATQAEANSVIYDVTESDGKVSATSKHIVDIKLSGYTVGADSSTKVTSGDTLGGALGKLQGQINGLDYSANAGTDKVITAITQTDGKVEVATQNITSRVITGYAVGSDAKIAETDTLGGALGKVQGQINAMDKSDSKETGKFVRTVLEEDGKVNEVKDYIQVSDLAICAATASEVTSLGANVKEAYRLVSASGSTTRLGEWIKIYKDSSIVEIYLGTSADTVNATTGVVTKLEGDKESLNYVYYTVNGTYEMVRIDLEDFLVEPEFESGVTVTNHIAHGVVDPNSESFLTVGAAGFKLTGINAFSAGTVSTINALSAGTIQLSADTNATINALSAGTVSTINALSAGTIQLSADTRSTINVLSAGTVSTINALSAGTIQLSADTVATLTALSGGTVSTINTLSGGTVSTINTLSGGTVSAINALSAGTIQLSADTVNAIAAAVDSGLDSVTVERNGSTNETKVSVKVGSTTKSGSTTVYYATNAGNADTVDGFHIVSGTTGTDANTIYIL